MSFLLSAYSSLKFGSDPLSQFSSLPEKFHALSAKTAIPCLGSAAGSDLQFSQLAGKVLLVTNVASLCGYTKKNNQWLSETAQKYSELHVLAFPCGQFNSQEYSDPNEVCSSHLAGLKECKSCFGKSLFLFEKIFINGQQTDPVFGWLRSHSELKSKDSVKPIPWNYCKFVVDKKGEVRGFFKSGDTKEVEECIEKCLAE